MFTSMGNWGLLLCALLTFICFGAICSLKEKRTIVALLINVIFLALITATSVVGILLIKEKSKESIIQETLEEPTETVEDSVSSLEQNKNEKITEETLTQELVNEPTTSDTVDEESKEENSVQTSENIETTPQTSVVSE